MSNNFEAEQQNCPIKINLTSSETIVLQQDPTGIALL